MKERLVPAQPSLSLGGALVVLIVALALAPVPVARAQALTTPRIGEREYDPFASPPFRELREEQFEKLFKKLWAEAGRMDYAFDLSGLSTTETTTGADGGVSTTTENSGPFSLSSGMPTLSLRGAAVLTNRFLLDVAFMTTMQGNDVTNQLLDASRTDLVGVGEFTNICPFGPATCFDENFIDLQFDTRVKYREVNLAGGYRVTDYLDILGGYRWTSTDLDFVRGGQFNRRTTGPGFDVTARYDFSDLATLDFDKDGPFAATRLNVDLSQGLLRGNFSASVAVAWLDGRVRRSSVDGLLANGRGIDNLTGATGLLPDASVTPVELDFDNSTVGVTLGASWFGATGVNGLTYSLSVSGYAYEFESDTGPLVEEKVWTFAAGAGFSF